MEGRDKGWRGCGRIMTAPLKERSECLAIVRTGPGVAGASPSVVQGLSGLSPACACRMMKAMSRDGAPVTHSRHLRRTQCKTRRMPPHPSRPSRPFTRRRICRARVNPPSRLREADGYRATSRRAKWISTARRIPSAIFCRPCSEASRRTSSLLLR